jgi:hypothetical protein
MSLVLITPQGVGLNAQIAGQGKAPFWCSEGGQIFCNPDLDNFEDPVYNTNI